MPQNVWQELRNEHTAMCIEERRGRRGERRGVEKVIRGVEKVKVNHVRSPLVS